MITLLKVLGVLALIALGIGCLLVIVVYVTAMVTMTFSLVF